jgi:outer membrane protein assembly factor BamD
VYGHEVLPTKKSFVGEKISCRGGMFLPGDTTKKEKQSKNTYQTRSGGKKRITFETFEKNYEKAMKHYGNEQFLSAAKLFEELYPLSMGTSRADTILFIFADCYFKNKNYEMAAFHFKEYAQQYPGTARAEEAYYKCVQAIYHLSPYYSLDQFETRYAIEEIDQFLQRYPRSSFLLECNAMLDELNNKLACKDFEILKLYYNTGNYRAVRIAGKNFQKEFASSSYASEAAFIVVKSNYEYAKKSVLSKQHERFQECIASFDALKFNYPNSPWLTQGETIADNAKKYIRKLEQKNKPL